MSGKRLDKPTRKRWTTSKVIALGVLVMDAVATLAVLALCGLAIVRRFEGQQHPVGAPAGAFKYLDQSETLY